MLAGVLVIGSAVAASVLVYGWLEAGWLRTRVLEIRVRGLPAELDGLRIGHLSDFHFGAPLSRGNRASLAAARWVAARRPELVCITGDLVSRPRGERRLSEVVGILGRPFVVLGNHDVAVTRDPFSRTAELRDLEQARLLGDAAETVELRGARLSIVGVDPVSYHERRAAPHELVDPDAGLRILLCHFPGVVDRLPAGAFDLILAGHLHAGQICLPWPGRRITLAHPRARLVAGVYETDAGLMHVSPGSGTTFVPFRFFARPEATELVLRRAH
jgi:predicted MPP superfamily phosphohydrolase